MKHGSNRDLYIQERFAAGSMAGAISQSAIYPMEVRLNNTPRHTSGHATGFNFPDVAQDLIFLTCHRIKFCHSVADVIEASCAYLFEFSSVRFIEVWNKI